MATITIRHVHRRQNRNEKELTVVEGEISLVGRNNSIPAGSFGGLRQVHSIVYPTTHTARRAVIGSASTVVKTAGGGASPANNVVVAIPICTGTTGTRAIAGIGAIGSAMASGTVVSSFIAYGI